MRVDGKSLQLGALDEVVYPLAGTQKESVIRYYWKIAPALLNQLKGRPVVLWLFPRGAASEPTQSKQCPQSRPEWLRTIPHNGIEYCAMDDRAALMWATNLGCLEFHSSLCVPGSPRRPAQTVFAIEPGAGVDQPECAAVALRLRDRMEAEGFRAHIKLSGNAGFHVHVPLRGSAMDFERARAFARAHAEALERETPRGVIARMARKLREGKVLVDWSANDENRTFLAAYSLRATDYPSVAAPIRWEEVAEIAAGKRDVRLGEPAWTLARLEREGDLFADPPIS